MGILGAFVFTQVAACTRSFQFLQAGGGGSFVAGRWAQPSPLKLLRASEAPGFAKDPTTKRPLPQSEM